MTNDSHLEVKLKPLLAACLNRIVMPFKSTAMA